MKSQKITKNVLGLVVFIGLLMASLLVACGDNTPLPTQENGALITPQTSSNSVRNPTTAPTTVTHVTWSPDGKMCAAISRNGTVSILDAKGQLVGNTKGVQGVIITVVWSPNSKYLAVGSAEGIPMLLDTEAQVFAELKWGFAGSVTNLAWSPDGTRLAAAFSGQVLRVWKTEGNISNTVQGLQGITFVHEVSHIAYPITDLSWSPNSATLAVGTDGQGVQFLDKDGKGVSSTS